MLEMKPDIPVVHAPDIPAAKAESEVNANASENTQSNNSVIEAIAAKQPLYVVGHGQNNVNKFTITPVTVPIEETRASMRELDLPLAAFGQIKTEPLHAGKDVEIHWQQVLCDKRTEEYLSLRVRYEMYKMKQVLRAAKRGA